MLLRDTVYQSIRRAILMCDLQPGQELREHALAEQYRVSRSPVRDALLRLEQENLVTVLPRRGYRVNSIVTSDIKEVFDLRLLIEPACAATAARADDSILQALDRFRGPRDGDESKFAYIEHNESFHRTIADVSGNTRLAGVAFGLIEQIGRVMRITHDSFSREAERGCRVRHEDIIDAIRAHDADRAFQLSGQHTEDGNRRVAAALRIVL